MKQLLTHDLNLFAYHLPLDAHPDLGNNAQLGALLGVLPQGRLGDDKLGWAGALAALTTLRAFAQTVSAGLDRVSLVTGEGGRPVRTIDWCTSGAQGWFDTAMATGVGVYLSGETPKQATHLTRESSVAYTGAGHHATECDDVRVLGTHLAGRLGVRHILIDIPNPVWSDV